MITLTNMTTDSLCSQHLHMTTADTTINGGDDGPSNGGGSGGGNSSNSSSNVPYDDRPPQ